MFPFGHKGQKIKGTMVVMQKNVLDINSITSVDGIVGTGLDFLGSALDTVTFLASSISIQLISATKADGNYSLHFFLHLLMHTISIFSSSLLFLFLKSSTHGGIKLLYCFSIRIKVLSSFFIKGLHWLLKWNFSFDWKIAKTRRCLKRLRFFLWNYCCF